jgi:hypothetical protein
MPRKCAGPVVDTCYPTRRQVSNWPRIAAIAGVFMALGVSLLLYALIGGCKSSSDRRSEDPYLPGRLPEDSLPPTDSQWVCALSCQYGLPESGIDVDVPNREWSVRVDYLKTHGVWFCAVLRVRSGPTMSCVPTIGWLRASQITYRDISGSNHKLVGSSMDTYLRLLAADSLWVYCGPYGFWDDESWWERTFIDGGWSGDGVAQGTTIRHLDRCDCYKQWRDSH